MATLYEDDATLVLRDTAMATPYTNVNPLDLGEFNWEGSFKLSNISVATPYEAGIIFDISNTVMATPYEAGIIFDISNTIMVTPYEAEIASDLKNIVTATPYEDTNTFDLSNIGMATPYEAGIAFDLKDIVTATPYENVVLLGLEEGFELKNHIRSTDFQKTIQTPIPSKGDT
ncbi:hypothetical protein Zmor_014950 [Zophobas morio]|uniref:Uncharacterized protein n=1 Tax=Zophobas morio TaxID=2755281 RepID=A0AA38IH05_9CUCU|nr:hypothetical protein Zmor_014950 [Zophobas morio]